MLKALTSERSAVGVTDGNVEVSSVSSTHSELLEGERVVAAVVDVLDDVCWEGGEGGEVAGDSCVQGGDAAGKVYLPPIKRVFYNSST